MAQDIVGSLFGATPQALQAENANTIFNRANQFANLTPMQQAQYGIYSGGAMLGQGIGGLLGGEDPRLQQAKQMQQVKEWIAQNNIDMSTAEGVTKAAEYARQNNMGDGAIALGQAAAKMRQEEAQTYATLKKADAEKLSPIARMLVEANYDLNSPEAQAIMRQAVNAEITGKVTPKTVVNMSNYQEPEFFKKLGEIQGKQMEKAYNTRDSAIATLGTLTKMSELNDQQLISGSFAGGRVGAANLLNTLGLASEADAKRLSNSQQFNKVAGDLVLANIKQLGYNPSNADVKFLNETLPNLESSPAARRNLINWMAKKAQGSIAEVRNMESYALKNKSLNGYVPTIPNFNPTGGTTSANMPKPLSEMTTEELKALRAKQQK